MYDLPLNDICRNAKRSCVGMANAKHSEYLATHYDSFGITIERYVVSLIAAPMNKLIYYVN
jgi:hypothetical protein